MLQGSSSVTELTLVVEASDGVSASGDVGCLGSDGNGSQMRVLRRAAPALSLPCPACFPGRSTCFKKESLYLGSCSCPLAYSAPVGRH